MKNKETLEEAAENSFLANKLKNSTAVEKAYYIAGFRECAKWKQEISYSEEELLNLLTHFAVEIQRQNKKGQYPIQIKGWFERNKDKFKNR